MAAVSTKYLHMSTALSLWLLDLGLWKAPQLVCVPKPITGCPLLWTYWEVVEPLGSKSRSYVIRDISLTEMVRPYPLFSLTSQP